MAISPLNWNTNTYKSSNLKAFISIGASPSDPEEVLYLVNLTDDEHREYFQEEFSSLDQACSFINERWGDWEQSDLANSGSGCGTCEAH
ncbi:MAG: hypothetical protein CME71_06470 [Halobacteriovorax sp.]|nr:hypothetical protein [Halobacteriovorax sp.]